MTATEILNLIRANEIEYSVEKTTKNFVFYRTENGVIRVHVSQVV